MMKPSMCLREMTDFMKSQLSGHTVNEHTMNHAVVLLMRMLISTLPTAYHMLLVGRGHLHVVLRDAVDRSADSGPPLVLLHGAFSTCRPRLLRVIRLLNDYRHR